MVCLLVTGCSVALVRKQPPCSVIPPAIDTGVAVVFAAAAASRLGTHASDQAAGQLLGEALAFGIGSAVFAASAIYGYLQSNACASAQ